MKIAVCAIGFNRPDCMSRLLNSLDKAEYDQDVTLIVSIDRSKDMSVKYVADDFAWTHGPKKVILQPENLGLRKHVLTCGGYMEKFGYDALVVLEDDITVSPYYLQYVQSCLEKYGDDDRVAGFSLYNFAISYVTRLPFHPVRTDYDVYMMNCAMSWGQVWTPHKWRAFIKWYETAEDIFDESKVPYCLKLWSAKSWLKYHTRYCIETNKYFVFPYESLSTNNNDVGTHAAHTDTSLQSYLQCLPYKEWRLPSVNECMVKYDGFFEPKFLADVLTLDPGELTVDLYGCKKKYNRYVLTRKSLPCKVVSSFALKYKPIEANIMLKVEGDDIYLYDTTIQTSAPRVSDDESYFVYNYQNAMEHMSDFTGLIRTIQAIWAKQAARIKYYKKKFKK